MNKIVVVDYGVGNLRSVAQALRKVAPEADVQISGEVAQVRAADRLVFPGQGAMGDCMACLEQSGLKEVILDAMRNKPMLGVCVGEQLFFDASEEGNVKGLGVFGGKVVRFQLADQLQADGSRFKIPQMGWNRVRQALSHPLWHGISDQSYFYFVHSYYAQPSDAACIAGMTDYGGEFCSAIARENIFATQFHPEKSAQAGLQLYRNFVEWKP